MPLQQSIRDCWYIKESFTFTVNLNSKWSLRLLALGPSSISGQCVASGLGALEILMRVTIKKPLFFTSISIPQIYPTVPHKVISIHVRQR